MKKVLIFGDSHSSFFRPQPLGSLWTGSTHEIKTQVIAGATIRGFGKSVSSLNVKERIIEVANLGDVVVLCFGQVDIELGLYYRRVVKKVTESDHAFMLDCISAYQQLLDVLLSRSIGVVIKGLNYPALVSQDAAVKYTTKIIKSNISDEDEARQLTRKLKKELPGIMERINLTRQFNLMLHMLASQNGLPYFDINDHIAYPNGLIREEFLRSTADNHICDSIKTRIIHLECLNKVLG